MSSDLVWTLINKHNAFKVKSNGITLSKEAGNVTNTHSYKASGIANVQTVGVTTTSTQKKGFTKTSVVATLSNGKKGTRVANTTHNYGLRSKVNKTAQADNALDQLTTQSYYRADLTKFAKKRAALLNKSLRVKATGYKKKQRRRNNKN